MVNYELNKTLSIPGVLRVLGKTQLAVCSANHCKPMATTNAVTTETLNNFATFLFKMQMACNFIGRFS